jgi:hypothetical protein
VAFDRADDGRRLRLVLGDKAAPALTRIEGDITDLDPLGRPLDDHAITNVIHLAALQVPFVRADPPLDEAVARTVALYRDLAARGRLAGVEHGLAA